MDYLIRIEHFIGKMDGATPEQAKILRNSSGKYLERFDYGKSDLSLTDNPLLAMKFPSPVEAWDFWRQQYGVRPDGKPNRPLTSFTVMIIPESQ